MLAALGFAVQAWVTGKGPIDNAVDHLRDPFGQNSRACTLSVPVLVDCSVPVLVDCSVPVLNDHSAPALYISMCCHTVLCFSRVGSQSCVVALCHGQQAVKCDVMMCFAICKHADALQLPEQRTCNHCSLCWAYVCAVTLGM